ncbi:phosphatase PAP2 family protein [Fusobacterium sp.]|uniref:phosphatase PAP2 family protein n=1 Tax=Fusobacterium sp. TaxID=68766 RepID=UPI002903CE8B|nr:phosphatase PAP2 family protein [Fusobacterium sp.]MDU1912115.1 phosphatase PAP2 family protein [Fusobacterium sp.]
MFQLFESTDVYILFFIQNHFKNSFLDKVMPLITKLGSLGIFWITLACFLILIKKYRRIGITIFISIFLCALIGNIILKPLIKRIRPFDLVYFTQLLISAPKDFSFPSGHTMASFASATIIISQNKKWGIYAFILAFLIGFSRLYLFVHFPSDVIIGAIIGSILGIFSIKLYNIFIGQVKNVPY